MFQKSIGLYLLKSNCNICLTLKTGMHLLPFVARAGGPPPPPPMGLLAHAVLLAARSHYPFNLYILHWRTITGASG
jgi:hypothetical protein